ncbi:MAG: dicarboxylate/amino acid:cation symporter [Dysgonamonadaceae bacterium]|jgi:Na+/H+-dicarboxylate symporter|nr:dicarboxylate/amino acid:cation symporter [Dysgonamonadaceae bacterium]
MNMLKNYAFTLCLLCGIFAGGICGIVFREETAVVKPIGDIFLNLLFTLIVPLVFFSVSSSICNMKQSDKLGKVFGNIFLVFLVTAVIAAVVAYVVTLLYNPLGGISKAGLLAGLPDQTIAQRASAETVVNTFTVSDFLLLFTKANLLPLIIFSILLGLATAFSGEKGKLVTDFLNSATHVILKMMNIAMIAAPLGLGCYFANIVGHLGGQLLNGYLHAFILFLILTGIGFFGLNSVYAFLSGGKNGFIAFWKNILTPSLTAIATSSSAACIPVNMEAAKRIGIPVTVAETVIPLGTNIHKDGSVMSGILKITFLLTIFGQDLTTSSNVFMILGAALLVGIVVGAIPSGGMTGELLICSIFGFDPQLAGTLMIISTIVDIPATLLNAVENVSCTMLITRLTEGKNWMNRKL